MRKGIRGLATYNGDILERHPFGTLGGDGKIPAKHLVQLPNQRRFGDIT